jgi:microcystin degradation protein MlrC
MADVTDNPGSGHYGDSTNVLKAMIESNLQNALFYAIYDGAAVSQGISIGIGKKGVIKLGGKQDPTIGGESLILEGLVVSLTDGSFPSYGQS